MFRQRPGCICYYVTTGKWQDDPNLVARRTIALEEPGKLQIFDAIELNCYGANDI